MEELEKSRLYRMMHPAGVAFWGASSNPTSMGSVQLNQLLAMKFNGPVFPIHPKEEEIMGLRAYKSIADVPGPVDLAVFVVPTRVVPEILEDCGKAGVKGAIIVTAGFGEKGEEGIALQRKLVEIATRYGIRFLGPNCIGVVNAYARLNTTFFPYESPPGFIGMVSQSGSFVTQMFVHLEKFGLGFSQAFSVGNEAMTDMTDCLEYLGRCPHTKVVGLYVETIRRGREFARVAREVSKKKPIVAYYVGGSSAGKQAALSHTGALAGPDAVYDGVFRQCGIVRARTIEEMFDMCAVLGSQPVPNGDRVAILTHSGGPGAAAADAAERGGLTLAALSEQTLGKLREVVPHTATLGNPVDLTFYRNPDDYTTTLPRAILDDPGVDSLFMYFLLPVKRVMETIRAMVKDPEQVATMAEQFINRQAELVTGLGKDSGKPIVGATFFTRAEPFVRKLQDMGVFVLPSPERAVTALAALTRYAAMKARIESEDGRSSEAG
ncbi:MAG: CoA-binding protein [Pseudomonadota bacterium]